MLFTHNGAHTSRTNVKGEQSISIIIIIILVLFVWDRAREYVGTRPPISKMKNVYLRLKKETI